MQAQNKYAGVYTRRDEPDPPAPPTQTPPAPVKEPQEDTDNSKAPVREPGPEPEKRY